MAVPPLPLLFIPTTTFPPTHYKKNTLHKGRLNRLLRLFPLEPHAPWQIFGLVWTFSCDKIDTEPCNTYHSGKKISSFSLEKSREFVCNIVQFLRLTWSQKSRYRLRDISGSGTPRLTEATQKLCILCMSSARRFFLEWSLSVTTGGPWVG